MWSDIAWYYLSFKGRISRQEFRLGYFGLIAALIALRRPLEDFGFYVLRPPGRPWYRGELEWAMALSKLVLAGILLWPMIAIFVKRLHDANLSGWWLMVPPAISAVAVTANLGFPQVVLWAGVGSLFLIPGNEGDNRFGADPLAHLR